jgi:hypothetical protein
MQEQQTAPPEPAKTPSFTDKIAGIFAAPGDLYEQLRLAPPAASNWVVPTLILIILTIASMVLVLNDSVLFDQMMAPQREALAKAVQEGKITQQAADQQEQMVGSGSPVILISLLVTIPITIFAVLFLFSFVFWLIGKLVMKATAPFMKIVEVYGLTFYIGALGVLVTAALRFGFGSFHASPSLALLVLPFDAHNKLHLALSAVNIFTIWGLVVTSIGLARVFQRDFPKVLVLIFAVWILLSVLLIFLGIPMG